MQCVQFFFVNTFLLLIKSFARIFQLVTLGLDCQRWVHLLDKTLFPLRTDTVDTETNANTNAKTNKNTKANTNTNKNTKANADINLGNGLEQHSLGWEARVPRAAPPLSGWTGAVQKGTKEGVCICLFLCICICLFCPCLAGLGQCRKA